MDGLKLAYEQAPAGEAKEQAKVNYYTALYGQSWLVNEKNRIAKEQIEPVLKDYSDRYSALKNEGKQQQIFVNLASALKEQESADAEEVKFLQKQLGDDNTTLDVLNRQNVLNATPPPTTGIMGTILNVLIALLGLFVVYTAMNSRLIGRLFGRQETVLTNT